MDDHSGVIGSDQSDSGQTSVGTNQQPRVAPVNVEDLLVQPKQTSFSVKDLLNDKTSQQCGRTVAVRRTKNATTPKTVFQCEIPQTRVIGPDNESWNLRCFCEIDMELGFMIQCETCLNWQHATCVNINANTLPQNYVCPICAGIHIRCACEENMNYKHPLVRCSKCGYYVHRRCEELDSGPYHPAGHVCRNCGGSPNPPPDVSLPYDMPFDNGCIQISQPVISAMHPSVLTAPFASILTQEFMGKPLNAFQLCEMLYNRYRPFFYLAHPQVPFCTPKKRRGDVSFSFFRAVFYVLDYLYATPQEVAIMIFDTLAKTDIYQPYKLPTTLYPSATQSVEFSDLAKIEFEKMKHIPEVAPPELPPIAMSNGGIYSQTALQVEQLIGIADGFVGTIDEFNYDTGVDSKMYIACGTKFVLDTRKRESQFIHNFRRSLSPNCVVKLVKSGGYVYAGIFAGVSDVNGIARRTRREKFSIPPNTELLLPIDFVPAVLEEPADFTNWHFDEIEVQQQEPSSPPTQKSIPRAPSPPKHARPSREQREEMMVIRQVTKSTKKSREKEPKPKIVPPAKRKPGKPPRSAKHHTEVLESSLFSLFKSAAPDPYLFSLPTDEDEELDEFERARGAEKDRMLFTNDVDCSFIDKLLATETPTFTTMEVENPVTELLSLVNLDGL